MLRCNRGKSGTHRFRPVLAGIPFAAAGIFLGAGAFFYRLCLTQKANKSRIFSAPHNQGTDVPHSTADRDLVWLEEQPAEDRVIFSEDGLCLRGLLLRNPSQGPWVILCHGYMGNAEGMAVHARRFYEQGYQILIPDARGHGKSEGEYIGMGWPERRDVVRWAEYLVWKEKAEKIALLGVSMGGATVMMTSGEDLPVQVRAIVEDCGYTSVWDEFHYQFKMLYHLPAFPLMYVTDLFARIRAGYGLKEASALKQVAKCRIPMLFIHGKKDTFVPYRMLKPLYEAAACPKEYYVVENAGHGEAHRAEPVEYWNRVFSFLEKYMGDGTEGISGRQETVS
ncbi:MAG: alpha/beta hydrolase [Acetatifactor sp.]|nr:alpha/beta hydrolase [Acetatifactor sp.]